MGSSFFFHLRSLSQIKTFLSNASFAFIHLGWIATLYMVFRRLKFPVYKSFKMQQLDYTPCNHVTTLLRSLHWLPVQYRIEYKILLFVYKSLNNLAPFYLTDLLHPYTLNEDLDRETNSSIRFQEPAWKQGEIELLKWLAPLCGIISRPKLKWLPLYLSLNLFSKLICLSRLLTCNFILFLLSLRSDYWFCLFLVYLYCTYCTALWSAGSR